ncbi:MAG TPA: response regulator [Acetobacteraceae bacterium]
MASRFHILIVEDEQLIVEVLNGTLEFEYHVSSAATVRDALAFLRTSRVDVVLLDSILPDGCGVEVARAAEAVGAAVIEMSGYPEVMEGLQRSGRPHLCKPFGQDLLLATIASVVRNIGEDDAAAMRDLPAAAVSGSDSW